MANSNYNNDLTIREIEYSILIKDKDKGFHELDDILRSELTRFEETRKTNKTAGNPIYDFLKTNIERSIVIRDNTKVYFLDYSEHGSLTIQFKLMVMTRYVNYGSTRQALDYLIKDTIGEYFEELLERHIPVSVSVQSADNELYELPLIGQNSNTFKNRTQRDWLPVILSSLALFIVITLGLIWFFQQYQLIERKKPSDEYRDKYYELLNDKQLDKSVEKGNPNTYQPKNHEADSGQNARTESRK